MSFLYTTQGITRLNQNQETSLTPTLFGNNNINDIDMLHRGDQGQNLIDDLYLQLNVSNKTQRFQAIVCHYSNPGYTWQQLQHMSEEQQKAIINAKLQEWFILEETRADHYGTYKCCCSQHLDILFYVKNRHNDNVLLIGSVCIDKFAKGTQLEQEKNLMVKMAKKCDHCTTIVPFTEIIGGCCSKPECQRHRKNSKTICHACLNLRKTTYDRCKRCYQDGVPKIDFDVTNLPMEESFDRVRQCVNDHCEEIFFAKADHITKCIKCFKEEHQQAASVGQEDHGSLVPTFLPFLPASAMSHTVVANPFAVSSGTGSACCQTCRSNFSVGQGESWKKICPACYKKSLKKCQRCQKSFAPKFAGAKLCVSCWQASK